jgi:hypothetical protein
MHKPIAATDTLNEPQIAGIIEKVSIVPRDLVISPQN